MHPLRILILSDGRPGHYNLSEGIAAAVATRTAATVQRFEVRRGKWPGAVLATMATGHLPAGVMLKKIYGIDPADLPDADLIVSAGAETLAASIWGARIQKVPNIHYGSIRLFDPEDFALVLTSYRRNANRPRHALAIKPSRIDPAKLQRPPPPLASSKAAWPPRLAALVIGGDSRGITYHDTDWSSIMGFLATLNENTGTRWLVANSRRTPDTVSDRIAAAAEQNTSGIEEFLDVRAAGAGTLTALLERCDAVLCTADSSSMVSECIWMQLPTIAVAPATFKLQPDEADYREWLETRGWCSSLAIAQLTPANLRSALARVKPATINRQEALTQIIATAVPSLFESSPSERTDGAA